ncbi:MAG TPA: hypothetical protein VM103_02220, partial [Candidatus Paceibacterota bacterium]|nr:hypothetical protein [Candidatus Paceibacterota bacterium]
MSKQSVWILIGILIIVIAGYGWTQFSKMQTGSDVVSSQTTNWSTYRSDQFSFTLKYPSNLAIKGETTTENGLHFLLENPSQVDKRAGVPIS